jgi:hypothetical protein
MSQPVAKLLEDLIGSFHRNIALLRVPNVETEFGGRQLAKVEGEFFCRLAGSLTAIHVLDRDTAPQSTPDGGIVDGVRVKHNRPLCRDNPVQPFGQGLFLFGFERTWGMEGDVLVSTEVEAGDRLQEKPNLVDPQGGEFQAVDAGQAFEQLQGRPEVAARDRAG